MCLGQNTKQIHMKILGQILFCYWLLKKGIYCWESNSSDESYKLFSILPQNPRYGIDMTEDRKSLVFLDLFHGIER